MERLLGHLQVIRAVVMGAKTQKGLLLFAALSGIAISTLGSVQIGASVTFASFLVYFLIARKG